MKAALRVTLALLALVSTAAGQELARRPVQGPARIVGREVSRFVLRDPLYPNVQTYDASARGEATVFVIPAAQFIPVSEDRDGVFFQSTVGLGASPSAASKASYSAGGLYVGKQKLGEVYAYFGDARGSSRILKAQRELSPEAQRKLLVANPETKPAGGKRPSGKS